MRLSKVFRWNLKSLVSTAYLYWSRNAGLYCVYLINFGYLRSYFSIRA